MNLKELISILSSPTAAIAASGVETMVPAVSGLYSIFVDRPESLPEPFAAHLRSRETRLIYVGRSLDSLHRRLVLQDLRHKNRSTFFRSIGAVLGYRPACGSLVGKANQFNYVFTPEDTRAIIAWIDAHLSVVWVPVAAEQIPELETAAIRELEPLLNDSCNPAALPELRVLREECRRIAQTPVGAP